MGLRKRLLQKWEPSLIWIDTLRKVERPGTGLPNSAIFLFGVCSVNVIPQRAFVN
jgi:hypothetical protein